MTKTKQSAKDVQIGGQHYRHMKLQPIDFIMANNLGFCVGNIIKYVVRYPYKNGKEDLLKAQHTINRLIQHYYGNQD